MTSIPRPPQPELCQATGHRWWQTLWVARNGEGVPVTWQRICRTCGTYREHTSEEIPEPEPWGADEPPA